MRKKKKSSYLKKRIPDRGTSPYKGPKPKPQSLKEMTEKWQELSKAWDFISCEPGRHGWRTASKAELYEGTDQSFHLFFKASQWLP